MAAWMPIVMSLLFAAEPVATAPKAAAGKVYVVYVTVVEVDADGNETVLFTPKVQTTGNPAGTTVGHVDGRSFEFHCEMMLADEPALARPAMVAGGQTSSTIPAVLVPTAKRVTAATGARGPSQTPAARPSEEFYMRTYDVSELIDTPENEPVSEADFAPLIRTIKTFAEVEGWTGKATIKPFISTKSLVIKQNAAGHQAVAAAIKKLKPKQNED